MARPTQRMPLELGLCLNINLLMRQGFIEPGKATHASDYCWYDADGELIAKAMITSDMTYRSNEANRGPYGPMRIVADWINQTIRVAGCPRHFGGWQWYFVCPRKNEFLSVLWSPPGKRFFAGRKAWGNQDFAYLSQFQSPDTRAHFMATRLCDRIGGPGASEQWGAPPRPKWMRWKTYERLSGKCEKYFSKAAVFPREHRLNGDVV
jgi:hypothetical protein